MTLALSEPLYVKTCVYVISMLSQGYHTIACNILGFFYVSINYVKYIFSSKIKKIEIVMYVHENMIWTSFQMYYRDLIQNKSTRFNFMFLGYGVHTL